MHSHFVAHELDFALCTGLCTHFPASQAVLQVKFQFRFFAFWSVSVVSEPLHAVFVPPAMTKYNKLGDLDFRNSFCAKGQNLKSRY
jgi:hypothetical protein